MLWAEQVVNHAVKVPITQDEFNALVDFVFNVGAGNFDSSTLLRELNAGDYAGAADQFARWDLAGGKVVEGLLRRRVAEADLFKTEMA
jgi:lysozyme